MAMAMESDALLRCEPTKPAPKFLAISSARSAIPANIIGGG